MNSLSKATQEQLEMFDDKFPMIYQLPASERGLNFLESKEAVTFAPSPEKARIKSFLTSSHRTLLEAMLREIEGNKRPEYAVGDAPGDNAVGSEQRAFGYNLALSDLTKLIQQALQELK